VRVVMLRNVCEASNLSMQLYADRMTRALQERCSIVQGRPWSPPDGTGRRMNVLGKGLEYGARYLAYPVKARRYRGDIFHIVDHAYGHLVPWLPRGRVVVTCHDLMLLRLASGAFGRGHRVPPMAVRLLRFSVGFLRRAARVIVDSRATGEDVVRFVGVPRDRIRLVRPGVTGFRPPTAPEVRRAAREQMGVNGRPTLLHVGNNWFYKNLEGLIRALAILRDKGADRAPLLVKVGKPLTVEQRRLAESLGVAADIRECGLVSGERLQAAYWAADALVFPSWWEGFGWPPLEAMASGTPVVCSDRGSLGETVAEAALIVDPADPDDIAVKVQRALQDDDLRRDLVAAGLERVSHITWEQAADATLDVYQEVLTASA
jgi:glycosyltransferase involved in cell wall biosynthesis